MTSTAQLASPINPIDSYQPEFVPCLKLNAPGVVHAIRMSLVMEVRRISCVHCLQKISMIGNGATIFFFATTRRANMPSNGAIQQAVAVGLTWFGIL